MKRAEMMGLGRVFWSVFIYRKEILIEVLVTKGTFEITFKMTKSVFGGIAFETVNCAAGFVKYYLCLILNKKFKMISNCMMYNE